MRSSSLSILLMFVSVLLAGGQARRSGPPIPPGLREANRISNQPLGARRSDILLPAVFFSVPVMPSEARSLSSIC
jgi:hypothetical protein